MIDRNCMVDRRIVLEAKLLREQGHKVILVAAYGILGDNENQIDGLPIVRFNESALVRYGNDPKFTSFEEAWRVPDEEELIQRQLEDEYDQLSRARFDNVLGIARRLIGSKLGKMVAALAAPRFSIKALIEAKQMPAWIRKPAILILTVISFNWGTLAKWGEFSREVQVPASAGPHTRIAKLEFDLSRARAMKAQLRGQSKLWTSLRYPRYGLEQLSNRGSVLRGVAALPLAILTFDTFIWGHLWSFTFGRFPFLDHMPEELQGLDPKIAAHFMEQPLDNWERNVLDFTCKLDQVDVVHAHDLPALRVATLISKRRHIPLIYDAHELYSYQPGVIGERKKRLLETEHVLIGHCDEIVVINEDQARVMQKDHGAGSYTPLTNATEQPVGFDINCRKTIVQDKLGLEPGTPTLIFMGGINRGRKIHLLFEGLAQAKVRAHLILLTWGMEIPEFEELAINLGIADRVHFMDPVPWSEIVEWAASVDVGVMPYQAQDLNTKISSPNKMYEFIAAGTPMIGSTELVNVKRVVEAEGFGVLVPFHEAADYAKAIDIIFDASLGGPERFRPALIAKADKYLFASQAKPFAEMYQRVLNPDHISKAEMQ
ncbi:MAG: glycosyltransferase family 4 protein [Burkholderiaceae bacterium]|jgi:glycosyltransferase involved in cell wall biosynthesis|nr:glycosyltransferase family 4 protein [Burkholderiaceae bacterium]